MSDSYSKSIADFLHSFDPSTNPLHRGMDINSCLKLLSEMKFPHEDFLTLLFELEELAKQKNITNSKQFLWRAFNQVFIRFWAKDIYLVSNHKNPKVAAIAAYFFLALKTNRLIKKRHAKTVARLFIVDTKELVQVAKELELQFTVLQKLAVEEYPKVRFQSTYNQASDWADDYFKGDCKNYCPITLYIAEKVGGSNV